MCKADAASYSSRADLGIGFERAFAAQSVLDDRLRIGLASSGLPRPTGSRAWMPGTRPRVSGTVYAFMRPSRLRRKRDWLDGVEPPGLRMPQTQTGLVAVRVSAATVFVAVRQSIVAP